MSGTMAGEEEEEDEFDFSGAKAVSLLIEELCFPRCPFVLGARFEADASNSLRTFVEMSTSL